MTPAVLPSVVVSRSLLALPTTSDRELISHRLWQFYQFAADCQIPEVHRLAQTIKTWWTAVEAAITTGYTNARSEGYNRLAKHVGREGLGSAHRADFRDESAPDDFVGIVGVTTGLIRWPV